MPVKHENYEYQTWLKGTKKPIFVPNEKCREIGKQLVKDILKAWPRKPIYSHLQPGGHVAALHQHRLNNYFAKFDLENFFYSISRNNVVSSLKSINIENYRNLACFSCVKNPLDTPPSYALPYGFVQSPLLATLVFSDSLLGQYLEKIANEITVSVYVDDIILSSNDKSLLSKLFEESLNEVKRSPFSVSSEKIVSPTSDLDVFNCKLRHEESFVLKERIDEFEKTERTELSKEAFERYCDSVKN